MSDSPAAALPRVSVVVLTHNRWHLLQRCLRALANAQPKAFEIIVVDNGSSDETPQKVRREFPATEMVSLPSNLGIRGRNEGFKRASGDVILSLDDDIELACPGAIDRIASQFLEHPALGALTLKLTEEETGDEFPEQHWSHPFPRGTHQDREFETDRINEAVVAFRTRALREVGYYYEKLFWGGEEWDLVLGLVDAGYLVRYFPEPTVHLGPRGSLNKQASPRHTLTMRNRFWIAFRRLPLQSALAFALPRLALWGFRAVRYGYTMRYLRALWTLAAAAPEIIQDRQVVSGMTLAKLRKLRNQAQKGQG